MARARKSRHVSAATKDGLGVSVGRLLESFGVRGLYRVGVKGRIVGRLPRQCACETQVQRL